MNSVDWRQGNIAAQLAVAHTIAVVPDSNTPGSIVYVGSDGNFTQDNSNLFYNSTTHRLGIGTATPGANVGVVGSVLATTSITAGAGFGCNGATAQPAYASGGAVVTTAPALASYGFTSAQAEAILTLLNNIQAALVANGIMS
jgi:hypothetical protein